jgi:tRNA(Ile)-lysidine synthase
VLDHIRRQELLKAGDRVGVAVSGGIDSVALLRLLLELRGELGIVLSVVHFNHKLRGAESEGDEQFVAGLAREFDLEFCADSDDVAGHAAEERVSVETAARELRYGFFRCLLKRSPSGAKAQIDNEAANRSAGSAAPPKGEPQWLKPDPRVAHSGTAEAVPFPVPVGLNKITTGHTLDDQAETLLMRMIRGAGLRGLGGIYPRIPVEDDDGEICGEIVRPLLEIRRRELEQYLRGIGQSWREDATNTDTSLTRNRVRKLVVPLLEKEFNPAVAENLAELAEIARGEEDYWENEVAGWMGTAVHWSEPDWAREASNAEGLVQIAGLGSIRKHSVSVDGPTSKSPTSSAKGAREMGHPHPRSDDLQSRIESAPWLVMNAAVDRLWFLGEPVAVQRRVVKAVGEQAGIPLEFKHVEEILRFAAESGPSGKELSLPLGWKFGREPDELVFLTPDLREQIPPQDYEYELTIPGQTIVREASLIIEVQRVPAEAAAGYNPDRLLNADSVRGSLRLRNWRPGDRFRPAHTKSPKKIKELLQELHVAQPERKLWPVVVSGDEIVWVKEFSVSAEFRALPGREAILISERPLAAKPTA